MPSSGLFRVLGDIVYRKSCRCARPLAIDETERSIEANVAYQFHRGLKISIGFSRKSDNEIGRNTDIRPNFA